MNSRNQKPTQINYYGTKQKNKKNNKQKNNKNKKQKKTKTKKKNLFVCDRLIIDRKHFLCDLLLLGENWK